MNEPVASREDTVADILRKSARTMGVPIRRSFLVNTVGTEKPPLAKLVRRADETGLDLYMLAMALASAPPYDVELYGDVWARALGLSPRTGAQAISRAWRRLSDLRLVARRGRVGRKASIRLLREDGSGEEYTHPGKVRDAHFKVPAAYWLSDYYKELSLTAKVVLMVALAMPPGPFELPKGPAARRYGVSPDSIETGRQELRDRKLLSGSIVQRKEPLAKEGFTRTYYAELIGDLARPVSIRKLGEVVPLKVG